MIPITFLCHFVCLIQRTASWCVSFRKWSSYAMKVHCLKCEHLPSRIRDFSCGASRSQRECRFFINIIFVFFNSGSEPSLRLAHVRRSTVFAINFIHHITSAWAIDFFFASFYETIQGIWNSEGYRTTEFIWERFERFGNVFNVWHRKIFFGDLICSMWNR